MIDLLPNPTIFIQWAIFMIAIVTLNWGIFKPVLRILKERESRTVQEKERAKGLEQKSEEMAAVCAKRMDEGRLAGLQKREERLITAEKIREELLKKTKRRVEESMEKLRGQLEGESLEASMTLKQYTREVSREIASKILEREV